MRDVGAPVTARASDLRRTVADAVTGATGARDVWRALGDAGALESVQPPGAPAVDASLLDALLTELDARLPLGVVLSVCVQVATVVPLLRELSDSPFAADVLARARRGEAVVALAVTDAGAPGSELLDARTEVRLDGTPTLVGGKDWITNATQCDYALVLARHRAARHFTSFRWALVPADLAGISAQQASSELFSGSGVGHLRFDAVMLADEHLVGAPGRALASFARHVATERLAGALWARALCRRVLVDVRAFLASRPSGDGTLWDNPAIRERFARCLVELHRIDALSARHVALASQGPSPASAGMVLKTACAESVERVLGECVSLRGASAFRDGGEARLRAEAAMFGIAGGATGALLAGVADHADELLEETR